MPEITQEFLVDLLQKQTTELKAYVDIKHDDLKAYVDIKYTELKAYVDVKHDEMGRMVQEGFAGERTYIEQRFSEGFKAMQVHLEQKLDVREQVSKLQIDMNQIKEALNMK